MNKPFPKAVLFDFDGVIVDSKKAHFTAWAKAFKIIFSSEIPPFNEYLEGKTPMLIAEYYCKQGGDVSKTKELYNLKDKVLKESDLLATLYPGVKDLMTYLKNNNIPYGIASNATRGFLKKNIEGLEIDVDTYTGFEDYTNPKPAPEAYEKLALKLGVSSENFSNTWVFEDSFTGLEAAIKANMFAVGVESQHTAKRLKESGAAITIKNMEEAIKQIIETECTVR